MSHTTREVLGYLVGVAGGTVAVALALPHSVLAPVIAGVLPLGVLAVVSAVRGPTVWRGLGVRSAGLRFWPVAVGVPVLLACLGYASVALAELTGPAPKPLSSLILPVLTGFALGTLLVLPEELGWRGFLLPRVQRLTSPRVGAVLTGLGHAVVHLPLVLWTTTYNPDGRRLVVAPLMVVTITASGVFYAWLRDASGSIWPAAIAHAAGDTLVTLVMTLAAAETRLAQLIGAGGVVPALGMSAVAACCLLGARVWRRPPSPAKPTKARTSDTVRPPPTYHLEEY